MNYRHPKYPNRLKVIRQNAGYGQRHVAQLLGHQNTNALCTWEREHAMPNGTHLIKLCIIYGKTPRELYPEYYQQVENYLLENSAISDEGLHTIK